MNHVRQVRGFTLIELMLAMTFISVLLLAIALTVLQISHIYNRGLTTKEVNVAARTITDDLAKDIASSEAFSLDESSYRQFSSGGRLCLGDYSYIWNYGSAINAATKEATYSVYVSNTDKTDDIRFVRVPDIGGSYCAGDGDKAIDPTNSVEVLGATDHNLAVHAFTISTNTTAYDDATNQRLYTATFTIGTNDSDTLTDDDAQCKAPDQAGSDLEYCSVQQFTIVLRAQNAVN